VGEATHILQNVMKTGTHRTRTNIKSTYDRTTNEHQAYSLFRCIMNDATQKKTRTMPLRYEMCWIYWKLFIYTTTRNEKALKSIAAQFIHISR